MDTSIETLMRQYAETTDDIRVWERKKERLICEIDDLTRKIRPKKWLNKIDVNDPMFKLYIKKLELIAEYDKNNERLEYLKATHSIRFNLLKDGSNNPIVLK